MANETKTYSDGTTATGPAPLPAQSPAEPAEAEVLALAEDYGQWMWDAGYLDDPRGESLVDKAAFKREEIKQALQRLVQHAYAEGRKDQAEATAHRGYVLFGAGAYLLTICNGDERGPELVAHLATEEEKVGRTVGDLGDVVSDKEIPLERVAMRLQFASEDGLNALEQQLRMLRVDHFDGVPIPPRALELLEDALELGQGIWRGDLDKDDREGLAFNLMSSTREYLQEIGYLWKPKA
jgi:hypothetical protein